MEQYIMLNSWFIISHGRQQHAGRFTLLIAQHTLSGKSFASEIIKIKKERRLAENRLRMLLKNKDSKDVSA
jgi:hypothetical protein